MRVRQCEQAGKCQANPEPWKSRLAPSARLGEISINQPIALRISVASPGNYQDHLASRLVANSFMHFL